MSDLKIANEDLYNKVKSMKVSNPQNVVYIKSTVENEKHDTMWTVKIKRDTIYGKPFIDKKILHSITNIESLKVKCHYLTQQ